MSAKKFVNRSALEQPVTVEVRQAKLELSAETVTIHKNGIEFRSPTAFSEWAEMTVTLQSPVSGYKVTCMGVIVACTGNRHAGYHVSMIFTSLTPQAEKELVMMAHSPFGMG
jgi:hypothetical protein